MYKLALPTAAVLAASLAVASAQTTFPAKNIEFVIPFGTGGGFDRAVRLISPYLEKTLPHKVEVLAKNVPGAGGRKGTAVVYRAKPDGYTIGIANVPGIALPGLTGEKVQYEFEKFTWVARAGVAEYIMAVSAKSSIKSVDDLKKLGRPAKFTSTGFGATAYAAGAIVSDVMHFPVQMLGGYKGSAEYILAVVRGDGDLTVAPVSVLKKFIEAGDMRGLFSTEKVSSVKGVPTVASVGYPQLTGLGVDRYVIAPPGLPDQITSVLSDALVKAMNDPELVAKAKKTGEPLAPLPHKEAKSAAEQSLELYLKHKSVIGRHS